MKEKLAQSADTAEIKTAMEELGKSSQKLAEEAYKQASTADGDSSSDTAEKADDDDSGYIDAEYEEK